MAEQIGGPLSAPGAVDEDREPSAGSGRRGEVGFAPEVEVADLQRASAAAACDPASPAEGPPAGPEQYAHLTSAAELVENVDCEVAPSVAVEVGHDDFPGKPTDNPRP